MPNTILLPLLASGDFVSGQDLADALGVSRTAVWKQLKKLTELGLQIESVKGKGYRIPGGIDLLAEAAVRDSMSQASLGLLRHLDIQDSIGSTNARAMGRSKRAMPPATYAPPNSRARVAAGEAANG